MKLICTQENFKKSYPSKNKTLQTHNLTNNVQLRQMTNNLKHLRYLTTETNKGQLVTHA